MKIKYLLNVVIFTVSCGISAISSTLASENLTKFEDYKANTENGAYLFGVASCGGCHGSSSDDPTALGGGLAFNSKFATVYSPNISSSNQHGIGRWSNADFLTALKIGRSPDGREYFGTAFPFASYANMTNEDLLDIFEYIKTLAPNDNASQEADTNVVNATLLRQWNRSPSELKTLDDPLQQRGQYLVEAVGHCSECHTPRNTGFGFSYDLDNTRAYEGNENDIYGIKVPPITPEVLLQAGEKSFFINYLGAGHLLSDKKIQKDVKLKFTAATSVLSVDDRLAIYSFLSKKSSSDVEKLTTLASQSFQIAQNGKALASGGDIETDICLEKLTNGSTTASSPMSAIWEGVDEQLISEADGIISKFCRDCHAAGEGRGGAYLIESNIEDVMANTASVLPGEPDASRLYTSITSGRMPLGEQIKPAELKVLKEWIENLRSPSSGKKVDLAANDNSEIPKPSGIGYDKLLSAITLDLSTIDPDDQIFIRYFDFSALPLPPVDCNQPQQERNPLRFFHAALNKILNSVSLGRRVVPAKPVDGTDGLITRIDMRDYGWSPQKWQAFSQTTYNADAALSEFDEQFWIKNARPYPYSIEPRSNVMLSGISTATRTDIPIIRADWFTHFAGKSPFYDMFLELPKEIKDLEYRLGVNAEKEIIDGEMVRAGVLQGESGVSDHNRMMERFDLPRGGYYWKSYDFSASVGNQSLSLHPDGPYQEIEQKYGLETFEHDGGEMIFSLPNGLQGYYLSLSNGSRLTEGPASIVAFRERKPGKGVIIENARSCFDCHSQGIIDRNDRIRESIDSSSRYSRDQLKRLQKIYPGTKKINEYYRRDQEYFIEALEKIGAATKGPDGRLVGLKATIGSNKSAELITYLSDFYFESVDINELAAIFYLDTKTFLDRVRQIGDPVVQQVVNDWLSRLEQGLKLHRSEVEESFANVLELMTDYRSIRSNSDQYSNVSNSNYKTDNQDKVQDSYVAPSSLPLDNQNYDSNESKGKLELSMFVSNSTVQVGDKLEFQVQSNIKCELQVFYVDQSYNVLELDNRVIGDPMLSANVRKTIPDQRGFQLKFDSPGKGETMFAYCRTGGLSDKRMTVNEILDFARSNAKPVSRGLSIQAAEVVSSDAGKSAFHMTTFNVLP